MWTRGVLQTLVGTLLLGTVSVNGEYIFTMGRSLEVGKGTDACLQLKDFQLENSQSESYLVVLNIDFRLRYYGDDDVTTLDFVYAFDGAGLDVKNCFKVLGPSVVKYYTDTYDVTAHATVAYADSDGQEVQLTLFNKTTEVKVYKSQAITLIQTDKPLYKPGQTVKFRVMTLDQDFMASTKEYPQITIQSPNGQRLMQWDNVPAPKGLVNKEMTLSSDPLLGVYKINVDMGETSVEMKTFKVEEYVLPKFEVTVTPPTYLTPTTNQIMGKVCAKYTYGKPVKGKLSMNVCFKNRWYSYDNSEERPCFDILEDIDGCYDFAVDSDVIGLANKTYPMGGQLEIKASVTEEGTDIELSGESSGPGLTTNPISIRMEDKMNGYFKPGFPYKAKVIVTEPDGSPAIGEEIQVSAYHDNEKKFEKIFFTDQDGIINVAIDQLSSDIGSLRLVASSTIYQMNTGYPYRFHYCSWRYDVYVGDASITVRQWYSPTDSYLYIPDTVETLDCGSEHELDVFYTTESSVAVKFQMMVFAGEKMVSMETVEHQDDGSQIDLSLFGVKPSELLDVYVAPPTEYPPLPPLPSTTEYPYYQEVIEEPIVPELYTPLGSGEARKKRQTGKVIAHFKQKISIDASLSPGFKVLIYHIRDDNEIVAATTELKVQNCFRHKTSMSFDKDVVLPGEDLNMNLQAEAEATCFVGMVDKSVNLLGGTGSQLSPEKVYERVRAYGSQRWWHSNWREDSDYCSQWAADHAEKPAEDTYGSAGYEPEGGDSTSAFRDAGLWLVSDASSDFRPCRERIYYTYFRSSGVGSGVGSGKEIVPVAMAVNVEDLSGEPQAEDKPRVRSHFPETWLWNAFTIGDDGTATITTTIPDTITEWVGNALCTHPTAGLGVTPIIGVTTFKPFFLSMTLPYSAIRGERLPLKITVFNYLENCLTLELNLDETEGIKIDAAGGSSRQFCLCGGEGETTTFFIIPLLIGEVEIEATARSLESTGVCDNVILDTEWVGVSDGVQRQLLVEAEGVPQDMTSSDYFCQSEEGEEYTYTQKIMFPDDMVPGSERATVAVVGDIMGPTLSGLKNLLRMPYGCGEQNAASLAPNIYVKEYLQATNQLTDKLQREADSYMLSGFQRQIYYRHGDKSYSAFGDNEYRNETGSGWLTAFVVKTMAEGANHVIIDPEDITVSLLWLTTTQLPDGCFPQVGKVFSSYMKGGLADGENPAGLTAFVLIALLEANVTEGLNATERGFECLDSFTVKEVDTYTLSVMFYAYTMYGRARGRRDDIEYELMMRKKDDISGQAYWKREAEVEPPHPDWWWYRAPGAEVEMTAYVLLSLLNAGPQPSIAKTLPIVQWLTQQRNSYGGFSSTQDTVVAVKALAKFAELTYSQTDSGVKVLAESGNFRAQFRIAPSNSLVYQTEKFNPEAGSVSFRLTGGCALMQVNLKYNIYKDFDAGPAFKVSAKAFRSSLAKNNCAQRQLQICVSYTRGGESNMAIANVKMLTGWVPVKSTLKDLVNSGDIARFEVEKGSVQIYLDKILNSKTCFAFDIEQEIRMNPKPGKVQVYDYYETEYTVTVPYEIKTTCGTKEEIPVDNEGLDCSIMQCRETVKTLEGPQKLMSCPECSTTLPDNTLLERIYCDSDVVYKSVVGRQGEFPVKIKADIKNKKKKVLDVFVTTKMSAGCTCDALNPAKEGKALIFTKNYNLNMETDELVVGDDTYVFRLTRAFERKVRHLSGRGKLCEKLARRRRKAERPKKSRRQQ